MPDVRLVEKVEIHRLVEDRLLGNNNNDMRHLQDGKKRGKRTYIDVDIEKATVAVFQELARRAPPLARRRPSAHLGGAGGRDAARRTRGAAAMRGRLGRLGDAHPRLMKRGIHGVYHHVSPKHLGRYLGEFAFRLNDGDVKRHTLDRLASLFGAAVGRRLTYKELIQCPAR